MRTCLDNAGALSTECDEMGYASLRRSQKAAGPKPVVRSSRADGSGVVAAITSGLCPSAGSSIVPQPGQSTPNTSGIVPPALVKGVAGTRAKYLEKSEFAKPSSTGKYASTAIVAVNVAPDAGPVTVIE